ncbi:MAG: class I SAM-dependent methyltransferase [Candidatus Omnitrophota bacterium]
MSDLNTWEEYWGRPSLKRNIIETLRRVYFTRVFAREVAFIAGKNARILEAGCGSGKYLGYLKKKGFECWGMDYSLNAIIKTRQEIEGRRLVIGDIKKLPFGNKEFELVYNQGVMEHFNKEDFMNILCEMKRIARKIVIIVPSKLSIFRIYDPIGDDPQKHFFSKRELFSLMSSILADVKIRYMWETGYLSLVGTGEA